MNNLKYYPTMFHTNPFSFNMIELWDRPGNEAVELLLNNSKAKEIGVSKMMLNVTEFSAFDRNGIEHIQSGIPNQVEFNSKGIDTEFFIHITSMLNLPAGTYTTIRFYLNRNGNSFKYNDGRKEDIAHLDYVDFEIWNGLKIKNDQELSVRMRFDFEPFSLTAYLRSLKSIFRGTKPNEDKLVNC